MTLSDLMLKLERFNASLSLEELYLLRGLVQEPKGRAMITEKIDRLIVYHENRKSDTHDAFANIMKGAW